MFSETLTYTITNKTELTLSYLPFIQNGGLFIPTEQPFSIDDKIIVHLTLPEKNESENIQQHIEIKGKIVWISPKNTLYHAIPGIGIQFIGEDAKLISNQIESQLDHSIETGGYVFGVRDHN